jgi:hypothetical protein
MSEGHKHHYGYFRSGGVDQVRLRESGDFLHVDEVDQKSWVALAMPTRGVDFDARTLELLDTDKDGRIRVPEVIAAVKWLREVLVEPGDLEKPTDLIALSAIATGPVLDGAKRILANLGKPDARDITLADVTDTAKIFANTQWNGDGVVPLESVDDERIRRALAEIIETQGSVTDRSGKPGVNKEKVEAFFKDAAALVAWGEPAETDGTLESYGDAATATAAVRHKIDDYFTRCRLAAFDDKAAATLGGTKDYSALLDGKDLSSAAPELQKLPLARIEAGRALPLGAGLNPAFADAIAGFAEAATALLLGSKKSALAETEWQELSAKLAPREAWMAKRPATSVAAIGLPRLRELCRGDFRARIDELIARDAALEAENAQIEAVERLLRYRRDLPRLLLNFVNFSQFYRDKNGIFQAGTLYLDGRACHLTVEVADLARHAALAALSATFLVYCECTRPGGEKMTIAAAVTDGDADNLLVGRNGIFYDRKGRDWDAAVVKIVSNPISLREAFWAPYKKLVRLIEEQVGKRAAAAEAEAHGKLDQAAKATAYADKTKSPEEPKIDVGTVAAIGVAIGGIGALVTGVLGAFFGLGAWMPLGVIGLLGMISGPSLLLAWLKLRQRNIGPILDANGWAVNGRARINVPFGAALTDRAPVPKFMSRTPDPYQERRRPWRLYGTVIVLIVTAGTWYLGKLDNFLPTLARSTTVLGDNAPATRALLEAKKAAAAAASELRTN